MKTLSLSQSFLVPVRLLSGVALRVKLLAESSLKEVVFGTEFNTRELVEKIPVSLTLYVKTLSHMQDPVSVVLGVLEASFSKLLLLLSVLHLFSIHLGVCVDVVLSELVDEVALVFLDLCSEVEFCHSERAHQADDVSLLLHAVDTLLVEIQALNSPLVPFLILAAAEVVLEATSEPEGREIV